MLPSPAHYLLRFDDLCPTVLAQRWRAYEDLIAEFGLQPILAAVPDNRDPELQRSDPDPDFWARLRAMEAAGAAVALHGYRHVCASAGRSLVPLAQRSEFAGVAATTQCAWICAGLKILRGYGLAPRLWVAPRHGFDRRTLAALKSEGIEVLSDGFARVPFTRDGMTWLPQQLWAPCEKPKGLWTICIHPNTVRDADLHNLRLFIRSHRAQFTSVDRVLREFAPRPLGVIEAARAKAARWRVRARRK